MKMIELNCTHCGKLFNREMRIYKHQNIKLKCKIFCSISCSRKYYNPLRDYSKVNHKHLLSYTSNRKDDLSPFKYFITKCKERKKQKNENFDVDLIYLKNLWKNQKGICPYTKIKMILPETTLTHSKIHSLKKASLDRIDSSKGYLKGNVEFVCLLINQAKNSYPKSEVISFLEEFKNGEADRI